MCLNNAAENLSALSERNGKEMSALNELSDIMTMQQIGETNKPLFFLNTNNFWKPYAELVKHMMDSGFIESMNDYHIFNAANPDELAEQVLKY